ncbi:MAG: T9SS type A sorting domain-containing protein [Ignavibacteriales bacterium]|nr:T9SS type A sorting domain-containing protein [Ignavibacteriales bacterium]
MDRNDRILASPWFNPQGVFKSTNGGTTWTHSNQGIEDFSVGNFGDDAFGNLYAIGGPGGRTTQLFRSSDSGATWVRIDTAITNRVKPAPDQLFNSISGDTLLFAATSMGLFVSSDQGATWQEANLGITDENPLGIVKLPSGRSVYSGTLGIFTKEPNDTVWTKRFPINGYQQFGGLARGGGSLFALAENDLNPQTRLVIRSTDDGLTWQYDTAGVNNVNGPCWYVDENGTQHLGTSWYSFAPEQPMIFSKSLGGSWTPDTLGLRPSGSLDDVLTFFSDRGSNLFAATRNDRKLWRRPIGGGTWVLDTTGLSITDPILMGTAGKNGTAYAATSINLTYPSTLHRRSGGTWSTVPLPPARNTDNIDAISVDSSGTLWVAFSHFYLYFGTGVYSTTDNGATWAKHGLDSVTVNFNSQYSGTYGLVSYGDTTYALTVGRGAFALTRSAGTTSAGPSTTSPRIFALQQNFPNPFNPSTTIQYDLPSKAHVRLRVFDVLGREVATLVNEERAAGNHRVSWNAAKFSSGVYFYRIEAGSFVAVRKLLLLK